MVGGRQPLRSRPLGAGYRPDANTEKAGGPVARIARFLDAMLVSATGHHDHDAARLLAFLTTLSNRSVCSSGWP